MDKKRKTRKRTGKAVLTGFLFAVLFLSSAVFWDTPAEEAKSTYTSDSGRLITFPEEKIDYIVGTDSVISSLKAVKSDPEDRGTVTYAAYMNEEDISDLDLGIRINARTGVVSAEQELLCETLAEHGGNLEIAVFARKAEGKGLRKVSENGKSVQTVVTFPADEASYKIHISFDKSSKNVFHLEDPDGNVLKAPNGENGWYQTEVTVIPEKGYTVGKTASSFMNRIVFSDQGECSRQIWLRNVQTGGITEPFTLNVKKIDSVAPDEDKIDIEYPEPAIKSTLWFYDEPVRIRLSAYDTGSGIRAFYWRCLEDSGQKDFRALPTYHSIPAVQDEENSAKYTGELVLPRYGTQFKGSIAVKAVDQAGLSSAEKTESDRMIVVDTVSPTQQVSIAPLKANQGYREEEDRIYISGDTKVSFCIQESNFYAEDVVVRITKDQKLTEKITLNWSENKKTGAQEADYILTDEGDYVIHMSYEDRMAHQDGKYQKKEIPVYTSKTITIDTTKPVMEISCSNQDVICRQTDSEGHERTYFDQPQTITVSVTEEHFREADARIRLIARDAAGNRLNVKNVSSQSEWKTQGNRHTLTITCSGDANYTFTANCRDMAGNAAGVTAEDYFTVDQTEPEQLSVSYGKSVLDSLQNDIIFGFYDAPVMVTITAKDEISGICEFRYDYTAANDMEPGEAGRVAKAIEEADIRYSEDGKTATAHFWLPGEAGEKGQFNGNIAFRVFDRSGNGSGRLTDSRQIVVDSISPELDIAYDKPVKTEDDTIYYDQAVTGMITVREANFYPDDVKVAVTKDGAPYETSSRWDTSGNDVYTGSFQLKEDGIYHVSISYMDKSGNNSPEYSSNSIVVDTKITEPEITINGTSGNGQAFSGRVVPEVRFEDPNFEACEVRLNRTRWKETDMDVTQEYIGNLLQISKQGGYGSFDTFSNERDTDGIYTISVCMTDKAGHAAESSTVFTVNRYGSVYVYDDYLLSLVKDGGSFVKKIDQDLKITEYNANRLQADSLNIAISRDGKPISGITYAMSPQINEETAVGSSGWYQYEYVISRDNFSGEGIYKIAVSSRDAAGNMPETGETDGQNILFWVDHTPPEIESITGLEKKYRNAGEVTAEYSVYDAIGLAFVQIYVDGKEEAYITDFGENPNRCTGTFTVSEKESVQDIRLVAEDLAGNRMDTDADDFESAYPFQKQVTVSTNPAAYFFSNRVFQCIIFSIGTTFAAVIIVRRILGKR